LTLIRAEGVLDLDPERFEPVLRACEVVLGVGERRRRDETDAAYAGAEEVAARAPTVFEVGLP
jgi:hypothetical protein